MDGDAGNCSVGAQGLSLGTLMPTSLHTLTLPLTLSLTLTLPPTIPRTLTLTLTFKVPQHTVSEATLVLQHRGAGWVGWVTTQRIAEEPSNDMILAVRQCGAEAVGTALGRHNQLEESPNVVEIHSGSYSLHQSSEVRWRLGVRWHHPVCSVLIGESIVEVRSASDGRWEGQVKEQRLAQHQQHVELLTQALNPNPNPSPSLGPIPNAKPGTDCSPSSNPDPASDPNLNPNPNFRTLWRCLQ